MYYIFYIFFVTFFYSTLKGVTFQFVWPNKPYFNFLIPSFASIINVFGALFLIQLLRLNEHIPKILKFVYILVGIFSLCIVINFFGYYELSSQISQGFTAVYAILFLAVGVYLLIKKVRTALFFLIAWTFFLISVVIFILKLNGVLEYNSFTNNAVLIGSALEALLLSLALADRINSLKKEKEQEQQEKLEALRVNAEIIENQKENL